jgi:hypothetical protein
VEACVVMARARKPGKRRTKTSLRREDLQEAILLIPLTYNDGTRVPAALLDAVHEELYAAFHGWTLEGTVRGAYRMRSGEKRVERLQRISVILKRSQLSELETMLARWGEKLGQETMLMKVSDCTVKFISPRTEKSP